MKNSKISELVELGISNKPHGIKGAFLFKLHNQEGSVLEKGSEVTLIPANASSSIPKEGKSFAIEKIQFGNKVIAYLAGVADRNLVEEMLPFKIFFPRSAFPEVDEGEVYLNDLIGLEVVSDSGQYIGKVKGHYDNSAQDILVVKTEKEIIELPFIDVFFPEVDLEKGQITMVMPEFD